METRNRKIKEECVEDAALFLGEGKIPTSGGISKLSNKPI